MARKAYPQPDERCRVRVTVVDYDGPSSALQQLAQALGNAVKAPDQVIVSLPAHAAPVAALPARQNHEAPGLFDQLDAAEANAPEAAAAPPMAAKPQNGAKRRGKPRTPVLVQDLDLTSGPKPFKDYFNELAPKDESKRYLVITQWLKEHRGIAEVGADHVYTCYRLLGISVPEDVLSVFRALKKNEWVAAGSKRGTFKMTHVGENQLLQAKNKE